MARLREKERFLPSLLDRLTDDDPINQNILRQKQKISRLKKQLSELKQQQKNLEVVEYTEQNKALNKQLETEYVLFNVLASEVSSLSDIRACVKRDLNYLLNANQYEPHQELESYPNVRHSVLNYGVPTLTGKTLSGLDRTQLEGLLENVLIDFEPRIIPKTLAVHCLVDRDGDGNNAITFEIEGQLWAEPEPLYLHLRTEFELESGTVSVHDFYQGDS
ncbi:MAG: type VI secretion system baseplate subunit TssE [Methyloprofundus sp.]|nr:type VI secretion system baseplate subunit TssE [Methyloprofundus sp.]